MIPTYCWRCRTVIPMLDEGEWDQLAPLLTGTLSQNPGEQESLAMQEAMTAAQQPALDAFLRMTGFRETQFNALWHHRRSLYGPDCPACGIPFRTAKASFCAGCGFRAGVS